MREEFRLDIKSIIEIIAILGVIGDIAITFTIKHNNSKKDSNNKNNISQQAFSGNNTYQSGRDTNVK